MIDGGVSSRTPRSDGVYGPSLLSTTGQDDSGTCESSCLSSSSLRGHSSIKDSSSVPWQSR